MKLALLHLPSPAGDRGAALAALGPALAAAGAAGSVMLVTPETSSCPDTTFPTLRVQALTREEATRIVAPLCDTAGCGVVLGYAERAGGSLTMPRWRSTRGARSLPTTAISSSTGAREKALYTAGDAYATFDLDGIRAALLICYDVEFAQHVAALQRREVRLPLVPTANMLPFTHVSRATVPAHAANGGMTIVYANFCGRERDLTYAGRSLIAGPRGEVVIEAGADATALIVAEMPVPDPPALLRPAGRLSGGP